MPWREGVILTIVGWCAFVCLALSLGPDLSVDSLHYHFYLANNAWGQGMSRDFLAAGLQSYLTPYAYIPLSWMQNQHWSTASALIFIASVQSLMVPALWLLACAVFDISRNWQSSAWRVAAVLAGLSSSVLLTQVGGTFIDLGTAIPVVLAGAMCAFAGRSRRPIILLIAAGAFLGLASALKWTQAPLSLAMVVAGAFASARKESSLSSTARNLISWITRATIIAASLGLFFCLVMAHWSFMMWTEFGNPIFPMANTWFKSPDFGDYSFVHLRFVPDNWITWITKPLVMLDIYGHVHTETRAPDAKPFLLCAVLCVLVAIRIFLRRPRHEPESDLHSSSVLHPRYGWALGFVGLAWVIWLTWSGNGRYAIAIFAVMGVVIVAIMARLKTLMSKNGFRLLLLFSLCMQTLALTSSEYRWANVKSWQMDEPFIRGSLPRELQDEPATFVTINGLTHAHLASTAHPSSRWLGLLGSASIKPQGPGFERAQNILAHSDKIYIVIRGNVPIHKNTSIAEKSSRNMASAIDASVEPYGLRSDVSRPCLFADSHASKDVIERDGMRRGFWYCPAIYSRWIAEQSKTIRQSEQDVKIERAMDLSEALCPIFLRPAKAMPSIRATERRLRRYPPTDATLIYQEGILRIEAYGSMRDANIGTVDQVLEGKASVPSICFESVNPGRLPWQRWQDD